MKYMLAVMVASAMLSLVASADENRASAKRVAIISGSITPQEVKAFKQGLRDAGYTERRDLVLHWRFAQGDTSRVPMLIAELLRVKPDVIVVDTTAATRAAKQATNTIPIVMTSIGDPVGSGLVESLARPGGNVTGLSQMAPELSQKRLEILKETIPTLRRVGVMWDPAVPWHSKAIKDLKLVASDLALALVQVRVERMADLDGAFATLREGGVQALSVLDSALYLDQRQTLIRLAARAKMPVMYPDKDSVSDGGLMTYCADSANMFWRSAWFVDQILRGAKPADLPVEQPTKLDLVVNLKTAKALGLKIPESIVSRADKVIR
jgi:putative tryptophan/tyrosine transport system substrate-binding protein